MGFQISDIEDELFLVDFRDRKDKKKVLDMCPLSFKKNSILLQEFKWEMTPSDIELKISSFWGPNPQFPFEK